MQEAMVQQVHEGLTEADAQVETPVDGRAAEAEAEGEGEGEAGVSAVPGSRRKRKTAATAADEGTGNESSSRRSGRTR